MKKVSVIIVNYNTLEVLKDCLENLEGIYPELEVIVVDNGSSDGSGSMVRENFKWVNLIESENNGLAAGYNLGTSKSSGEYLLYLGSDAFPEKDTILGIVGYLEENPNIGAATCKLVLRSGDLDSDAHRGFPTPWNSLMRFSGLFKLFPRVKLFNGYFMGYKNMDEPHEIDACISHFMFVKKEAFDDIGGFDEDYFLYGEDFDFCFRLKERGWKVMYLPQWKALHFKGVSVGVRGQSQDLSKATAETRMKVQKMTIDAMRIFVKRHYLGKYPKPLINLMFFGMFLLGKLRLFVQRLRG